MTRIRLRNIVAARLSRRRKQLELSQNDVAIKTGLNVSAVSHFECGTRTPTLINLLRLADVLNASVDYFLGRRDQ